MAYPVTIPTIVSPHGSLSGGTDKLSTPSVIHGSKHQETDSLLTALMTKLGIDASPVTSTIDYLLKNPLSIDPGHKHTAASITAPGTSPQILYNNSGVISSVAGSAAGSGFSVGSVAFPRISAGTSTPLSSLSSYYGFFDGPISARDHGSASGTYLDTAGGFYLFGNLSGQGSASYIQFGSAATTLIGGTADININTNVGAQLNMSGSDGSTQIINTNYSNFLIADAGGGVTMRGGGDTGGVYAPNDGNTYVGWYSMGYHTTIDNSGSVSIYGGLRAGPDIGDGAFFSVDNSNLGGGQMFSDFNVYGAANSLRIKTDAATGLEFGVCYNDGEFHSDSIAGDAVFKGNLAASNNFRFGPGSGASVMTITPSQVLVGISTATGYGKLQVGGDLYASGTAGIGTAGGTSSVLTLGAGSSSKAAIQLASQPTVSTGVTAGMFWMDGSGFAFTNNIRAALVGNGFMVKEGTNACMGLSANMVAGVIVVNTNKVTSVSRIFLTPQGLGGSAGSVSVSARVVGTSFTITSTSLSDTRTVAWEIKEPSP